MTINCNIWMLYLELNWFCSDPSRMLQISEFVRNLRSSVWDVFNNFLIIDAIDRRKISSDQKRLFIAVSLCPLSFFANTPFKKRFLFLKFLCCQTALEIALYRLRLYVNRLQKKYLHLKLENRIGHRIFGIFAENM